DDRAVIGFAAAMLCEQRPDRRAIEHVSRQPAVPRLEEVVNDLAQTVAEPFTQRDGESLLPFTQRGRRQIALDRVAENRLRLPAVLFRCRRIDAPRPGSRVAGTCPDDRAIPSRNIWCRTAARCREGPSPREQRGTAGLSATSATRSRTARETADAPASAARG